MTSCRGLRPPAEGAERFGLFHEGPPLGEQSMLGPAVDEKATERPRLPPDAIQALAPRQGHQAGRDE